MRARPCGGAGRGGRRTRAGPHRHRGDREQQRPEGGGGHGPQQLGQRPLAAPQPGGGEQADADVRGEQQPGGGRVGVGEQARPRRSRVRRSPAASGAPTLPPPHSTSRPTERSGPATGPPAGP